MEQQSIEKLWAEEKYHVMYHSQSHYNSIRLAMRDKKPAKEVEKLIFDALKVPPTSGSKSNTCQHIWGYFKKIATIEEKDRYMVLLAHHFFEELLNHLYELAQKYDMTYLLESRVLKRTDRAQ